MPVTDEEQQKPAAGTLADPWTPRSLLRLVWPMVVEQLLAVTMGLADTVMVASTGEAAVSGVSLVDSINILLISAFTAMATGGAVVAAQYMGRQDSKNASRAARQLVYTVTAISLFFTVLCLALRRPILQLIFGHIEPDVMQNAETYFWLSALSYPFLALYNAGAALFRGMGDSRVSMVTSLLVNVLNIGGNAALIYGLGWGVAGAATSTLVSRVVAAVVLIRLLLPARPGGISLQGLFHFRLEGGLVRDILRIGLPNGLENSMFQIGKLLVARIISTFGTAAIAGNAVAVVLATFLNVPGMAIGMAILAVVGQCVGAQNYAAARRNTRWLLGAACASMLVLSLLVYLSAPRLLGMFHLSAEASRMAEQCIRLFCLFTWLLWPLSFALPNALRAAGDVRFTLLASMFSMWVFRIGSSFVFAYWLGLGMFGVWVAMIVDWVVRICFFLPRWKGRRWERMRSLS